MGMQGLPIKVGKGLPSRGGEEGGLGGESGSIDAVGQQGVADRGPLRRRGPAPGPSDDADDTKVWVRRPSV